MSKDTDIYKKIPTEIWFSIFEFIGFTSPCNRGRCIFLTKKGKVCKNNRINKDKKKKNLLEGGIEIGCPIHMKLFLNSTDKKIIQLLKDLIGKRRYNKIFHNDTYIKPALELKDLKKLVWNGREYILK